MLALMDRTTRLWHIPNVGRAKGRIIRRLIDRHRPTRAVEIGSLLGYSAILIAGSLPPRGRLTCIETSDYLARMTKHNAQEAGLGGRVKVIQGDALRLLPLLPGRFDFVLLAAYAAATTRVGLGNGVVPVYPRHPVAMAQSALTLNEVSGGRFRLGIGVSHKTSMEAMLGLRLVEPLAVMREYVAVLRGALGAGSEFEGRHYRVRWAMAVPTRPPAPPIYLAALSVKMLELAGEIADGVVLWLCPPAYVRDVAVPALERGRRRAGKPLAGFEVVAAVPLAVTDARAAAMAAFRAELKRYLEQPSYRALLPAAGIAA